MSQTTPSDVHYHVEIHPERHELRVRMRLTGPVAEGRIRLEIPTWVPGNYTFTQLGRDLFDVQAATTHRSAPLAVTRDGGLAFHVEGGDGDVTVTFSAWA